VMRDLRSASVDILTLGQYLRPTLKHLPVIRFVRPDEFADLKRSGYEMGFRHVESGPLVRSSYHAADAVAAGATL
jgi:lipoyl synthase